MGTGQPSQSEQSQRGRERIAAARRDEDDDMLSAMARELVERNGIGDTADSVWRALSTEHQKLFPTTSGCGGDATSPEPPDILLGTQYDPAGLVEGAIDTGPIVVSGGDWDHCQVEGGAGSQLSQNRRRCSA